MEPPKANEGPPWRCVTISAEEALRPTGQKLGEEYQELPLKAMAEAPDPKKLEEDGFIL
jgi:hypothetical protein